MLSLKKQALSYLLLGALSLQHHTLAKQPPINLTKAKKQVEEYYESGQYEKEMKAIVDHAINHFKKIKAKENSIIIFDIDDTLLDDYCNEKSINFGFAPEIFHAWVVKGNLTAIPEAKRLYDYAVKRGFHIILMTGRKEYEREATVRNLRAQGYTTFDQLILRNKNEEKLSAKEYKIARRQKITAQGGHIVGNIGDQWSDLEGGNSGYMVKFPNYRYLIP